MVTYSTFVIVPEGQQEKTEAIKTLNGELIPFKVDQSQPFHLVLGPNTSFVFSWQSLAEGIDFNKYLPTLNMTSDQFKIKLDNNKLYVSATIRDSEGKIITEIVNNTWQTVDPHYQLSFWDRNYNAYAFEVISSSYVPMLQVAMISSYEIQFGGLFYTKDGPFRISPTAEGYAAFTFYPKNWTLQQIDENATIPLLFNYPALTNASNLGKIKNPIYPANDPLAQANGKIQWGLILQIAGSLIIAIFGVAFPVVIVIKEKSKNHKEENIPKYSARLNKSPNANLYWNIKRDRKNRKKKKRPRD